MCHTHIAKIEGNSASGEPFDFFEKSIVSPLSLDVANVYVAGDPALQIILVSKAGYDLGLEAPAKTKRPTERAAEV
jgi:hypothetical protein